MSRSEADMGSGAWNGMMPSGNGMPFMPGLFGPNGAPDPAAIAAAYAQLQQQSFMAQQGGQGRGRYGGRATYPPDRSGIKKCGHCQSMKPCVEFSADTSRGDGLRGWCKMCEAEARSTRYKKRKAAAQQAAANRRRFEMPLGGMFWNNGQGEGSQDGQQPMGGPQLGNMDPQAMQQQLLAMLAFQQQQQQQGGNQHGHNGNGNGHALAKQYSGSAFTAVGRSSGEDIRAAAFAAANGHATGGSKGSGTPSDISGGSPTTSDSGNSAMERFKKKRIGGVPPCSDATTAGWAAGSSAAAVALQMQQLQQLAAAQQQAAGGRPPNMRRGSQDTDDSAAAMALAFGPAGLHLPLGGVGGLSAAQHAALAHARPQGAPLPPQEVHVPKRKRTCAAGPLLDIQPGPAPNGLSTVPKSTKYRGMDDLSAMPGVARKPVARKAAAVKQPEVVQWASRMMATLLLARAAATSGCPLALPLPPQPVAKTAAKPAPAADAALANGTVSGVTEAPAAHDAVSTRPDDAAKDEPIAADAAAKPEAAARPAAAEPAAPVVAAAPPVTGAPAADR